MSADSDADKLRSMRNSKGKLAKDLWNSTKVFHNIFTASRNGDVNTIRKMITNKPELKDSVTPVKERTPLIMAVLAKSLISVKYLVENGADQYHEDKEGKNAATYAQEFLESLKKKGKLTKK